MVIDDIYNKVFVGRNYINFIWLFKKVYYLINRLKEKIYWNYN